MTAALALAPNWLRPAPAAPSLAAGSSAAKIHKTAQDFEASFLTSALGDMFEGVKTDAPFGGGEGEATFRSFLNEAMAKTIVKRGGIGVSAVIERELIKLQRGVRA